MTLVPRIAVVGEICADLPIHPINHELPLAEMHHLRIQPIVPSGGGLVANSGVALAKLGANVTAVCCVGNDLWGQMLLQFLEQNRVNTGEVISIPEVATSATAVLVDHNGEHTFAYHPGASQQLTADRILNRIQAFSQFDFALLGYYALMPNLESDLPQVLAAIRKQGCKTALDAAGGGGQLQPLDELLPHLDVYVPSREEALAQTGEPNPLEMIRCFRQFSKTTLLGVKLGSEGALLSPATGEFLKVPTLSPPGAIVDTTGAGDCFYAGLLRGLAAEFTTAQAAKLGAAAGACSITQIGATAGVRSFEETAKLASQ